MGKPELDELADGDLYRSPFEVPQELLEDEKPSRQDSADESTLRRVRKVLKKALWDLRTDFNSFELLKGDPETVTKDLTVQIQSRQMTHTVLSNTLAMVERAINAIDPSAN